MFSCMDHAYVPDKQRKKLDGKSVQCMNLGVTEESKAYNLYGPVEGDFIIRRDVMFEESKCWNWNKKDQVNLEDS